MPFGGDLPSCLHDRQLRSVEPYPQKKRHLSRKKCVEPFEEAKSSQMHVQMYMQMQDCLLIIVRQTMVNCECSNDTTKNI